MNITTVSSNTTFITIITVTIFNETLFFLTIIITNFRKVGVVNMLHVLCIIIRLNVIVISAMVMYTFMVVCFVNIKLIISICVVR